jgi:hypothetical protein
MKGAVYTVAALLANHAVALPQAASPNQCITRTRTQLGIDTSVTNYEEFISSLDARYSTPDVSFTGTETVIVHTSVLTYPGGSFTGYYTYDANALRSAGYNIITVTEPYVTCPPTTTPTLPPSPTASLCSPHGDHCE